MDASHPTQLLAGTFEVELYARPGEKLDELVKIADAEIERLKKEGPTALEVRKAQNERESGLIMGLQSVTRKASVLNQYMAVLGDPLATGPSSRRSSPSRRTMSREWPGSTSAPSRSSSTSCRARRPRDRAEAAVDRCEAGTAGRVPQLAEVKDDVRPLGHAQAWPDAPLSCLPVSSAARFPTAWSS